MVDVAGIAYWYIGLFSSNKSDRQDNIFESRIRNPNLVYLNSDEWLFLCEKKFKKKINHEIKLKERIHNKTNRKNTLYHSKTCIDHLKEKNIPYIFLKWKCY